MPGKVNPSVPEAVQMACMQVAAHDHAIALAAAAGELELQRDDAAGRRQSRRGVPAPGAGLGLLRRECVEGLVVDRARARVLVSGSLIEATALSPYLGYDVTAALVKEARATRRPLRRVVLGHRLLGERDLARILSPRALTGPHATDVALRERVQRGPVYREFRATLGQE